MDITLIDFIFVVILVFAFPLYSVWDMRKLRARRKLGIADTRAQWYMMTLVIEWGLTLAVAVWSFVAGRGLSEIGIGYTTEGWGWWVGGTLALLASVFLVIQSIVILRSPHRLENVRRQFDTSGVAALVPTNGRELRWWTAVSVTAGVCEEFLYRGFLIAVFASVFNTWIALFLSSVIFGIGHAYQGPGGVLKTALVGVVLGTFYILSGSLWAPILVHIVLDISSGVVMRRASETPVALEPAV